MNWLNKELVDLIAVVAAGALIIVVPIILAHAGFRRTGVLLLPWALAAAAMMILIQTNTEFNHWFFLKMKEYGLW